MGFELVDGSLNLFVVFLVIMVFNIVFKSAEECNSVEVLLLYLVLYGSLVVLSTTIVESVRFSEGALIDALVNCL